MPQTTFADDGTGCVKAAKIALGRHWTLGETDTGELVMHYEGHDGEYAFTFTPAPGHGPNGLKKIV